MISGNLKSLCLLWANLAQNQRYRSYVEKEDISTFMHRAEHEGFPFLTTTLPNVGKALDRFHSTSEWISPEMFNSREPNSELVAHFGYLAGIQVPVFLGKAVELALTGDSIAVDCVRQLTLAFYKLEVSHDEEKVERFLDSFLQTDRDLAGVFESSSDDRSDYQDEIITHMRLLIGRVLSNSNPFDIKPSHGTGATACRTPNEHKYHGFRYFRKLDDLFSYSDYFFYSPTHLLDEIEKLRDSEVMGDPCARVCLVPKDSRGPRVISCEPAEMMYIQQGLMRKLYTILETHPLTAGYVNFTNQTINRELARQASKDGLLATIDLSDASDRVSLELVRRVFPSDWLSALEACRSEETVLPNHVKVKLNKFAPMGSACCFPVEALVFWACAQAAIHISTRNRHPREIYVYGDDIVTPVLLYHEVARGLESVGLLVNHNKSYWQGPFRESCGGDYHNGYDVTPVRIRKDLAKSRTSVATNADLINSFVNKFGYDNCQSLISVIEIEAGYIYPRSELQLPAVIRTTPGASNDVFFKRRFNKNLQRKEYRILTVGSISRAHHPPNWGELLRKELSRDRVPSNENSRYEHWADRKSVV